MRFIFVFVLIFPLTDCASSPRAYMPPADYYGDEAACRSYGAKPGTDIYIQCRMQRQQSRDAAEAARQAALMAEPSYPPPNYDAPIRPMPSIAPQRRCQSVPAGMGTWQTVCN
jgi:hypothetical protein